MLRPRIIKLHRNIDHDWQMTLIDFHVTSSEKALPHYDAGVAPVRDPGSTGMNRVSIGDDREKSGLHRETGKTGNDQRGTGNNRDGTSYGNSPDIATVHKKTDALPEATVIHRVSAGALPATTGLCRVPASLRYTGALPGRCRLSPGLNRGTTGDNRGYAGTLPAFTGALPATTGALPGLDRDKPLCRAVDRLQPGLHREILTGVSKPGWTGALPAKVRLGLKCSGSVSVQATPEIMKSPQIPKDQK
ncbi:hypothetical protein DPMN_108918 [Dreissena polymorpha]|uniref:Uncharacterized protein n=1 Tax=Dreissena polymorpha TaxID=45954 RepID=A0A9D4K9C4_DREPO|nr:hypothetical protein DPMN_108918 [Dreissena polymorpha]